MSRNTRDAEQILRIDGKGVFLEVTTNGLPIDKLYFGFVQYNKSAEKGQRMSGNVNIYMNVLEAQVLETGRNSRRIQQRAGYRPSLRDHPRLQPAVDPLC